MFLVSKHICTTHARCYVLVKYWSWFCLAQFPLFNDNNLEAHLYRASYDSILAESNGPYEAIMKRYKLLLKEERFLIPEDQPGYQLEGDQQVDGPSIPDRGPMLHNIHSLLPLNVSRATSAEVVVKATKVHLSKVFSIIHVGHEVNVCGPAEVVYDTVLVKTNGWEDVCLDPGDDKS